MEGEAVGDDVPPRRDIIEHVEEDAVEADAVVTDTARALLDLRRP